MGKAHSNAYCQAGHFFDLPYRLRRTLLCGRDATSLARDGPTAGAGSPRPPTGAPRSLRATTSTSWTSRCQIICTQPAAIAAAEAGKIVLCEKPLALSVDEARAMAHAARGVRTMVWFNYRRVPAIAYARQLIGDGRLGTGVSLRRGVPAAVGRRTSLAPATWRMDSAQAGSGVAGDLLKPPAGHRVLSERPDHGRGGRRLARSRPAARWTTRSWR